MSRSARLLDLLQLLRTHRRPVSGRNLAEALSVSLRTLYRDIATLQAQGADIEGAPGIGYRLKPGFLLPPIMLQEREIEALVLGMRWVASRTDPALEEAAGHALAKIAAVLPEETRRELERTALLVPRPLPGQQSLPDLTPLRAAIRAGLKVDLTYRDQAGATTERRVWPFALGYFEDVRVLIAWCELRKGHRHFRVDRIATLALTEERSPRGPDLLLAEWKRDQGLSRT
ncbi:helix-turn-helix transcriptional regulator [Rhizobium sp. YIM 134829]|uniref:helix-turn-helix transcriptional regulator n=1 Tax=Rhizobium sp. YIM 134829 TaxID=3390453 RepID=UPI003979BBE2